MTLLHSPLCLVVHLGQFGLICCPNLTLTLLMTLTLIREVISDEYMYAYLSVLIFTFQSGNIKVTLKKWHNETAAVYLLTGMFLPNLQPSICKISILG